ncbi:hypothetical protein N0B51_05725 [Tsuneonella sp. YG55]|uniref:Uncharacterized protein n=1 Tax=Tsuneonella litorea TaxID=2976475 RepID=A0A9X2W1F7_9SPHN|nr:hypothetical protein [Tsuneonella litorea]MCT2558474.1 hypothetical protein [Tsuneonella litorea]
MPVFASLACAAGCGGGDGASPAPALSASSPAPAPGPSAPPPSSPSFNTVPFALGQPAGFTYAVLGYRVAGKAGPFENIPDPSTIDPTVPLGLTYSGSGLFRLSVGGLGEGSLVPNGGGGIASADGRTTQFGFNALGGAGSIGEALDLDARPLASTAWGYLSITARPSSLYYADDYPFLYGVPTASMAVPTTGFADFRTCCDTTYSAIRVDYASGGMTATRLGDNITFIDVALGIDRSTFSGRFASKDGEGTVEGRFTGSDGRELMMRMIVPGKAAYLVPMRKID